MRTLVLLLCLAPGASAQSPDDAEAVRRLLAVDLDAVVRLGDGGDLSRGLAALVRGDEAEAERLLMRASVADSLRPFVLDRLSEIAHLRMDWPAVLHLDSVRAEARGEPFDASTHAATVYARYPRATASVSAGGATVPFDGYRIDAELAGPDGSAEARIFLDTGAPMTLLARVLAERLGLALDSASVGYVTINGRGIDAARVYRTVIDSLRIGDAVLRNLPADVIDTDRPVADEADLFLGLDAFSALLGGVRYGFADSTLTLYARGQTPHTEAPPNLLLASGRALISYAAGGHPFMGVLDTGSPFSYVYADWWTPPPHASARPVTHRGVLADSEYAFTLDTYDFPATLAAVAFEALPLGLSTRGQVGAPFRVMSLLGTGLFSDGALVLDLDRRTAAYLRP